MEVVIAIAANLVIGAILLAFFAWWRPAAPSALTGAEEALQLLRQSFPDARGKVVLCADGQAALMIAPDGRACSLLQRHGRRWNMRTLHAGDVSSAAESEDVITLRLRDFAWPRFRLRISDPARRAECLAQLRTLESGKNSEPQSVMPRA